MYLRFPLRAIALVAGLVPTVASGWSRPSADIRRDRDVSAMKIIGVRAQINF